MFVMERYYWIYTLLQILVLVVAISVDAFSAGFAYGVGKVRMPFLSMLIVSAVSAVMLGVSIGAGYLLGGYLPGELPGLAGFGILFLLGAVKLFSRSGKKEAGEANRNGDALLSAAEAAALGAALSLDSIAAGIGVGVGTVHMFWSVPVALFVNVGMMWAGGKLGKMLSGKITANVDWVSGALLLTLAVIRLFT